MPNVKIDGLVSMMQTLTTPTSKKSIVVTKTQQIASLGVRQIFKIFRVARGMDKSHRLGTETVGDHVKR